MLGVSQNKTDMCDLKTLVWQDQSSWHEEMLQILSDIIDDKVIDAFYLAQPKYIVSDDLSWIEDIIFDANGNDINLKLELFLRIQKHYSQLRAFHSSSPIEIDSYYRTGLQRLDINARSQLAKNILMNAYDDISEEDITKAINITEYETRINKVFFEANEKFLIEHCGHYLHYGSEYQVAIAASLMGIRKSGIDYRQAFRCIGQPTVFICDVPLKYIQMETLIELSGSIIEAIFSKLQNNQYVHPRAGDAFGFSIDRDLEPEYIVSHYQPLNVRDPIVK